MATCPVCARRRPTSPFSSISVFRNSGNEVGNSAKPWALSRSDHNGRTSLRRRYAGTIKAFAGLFPARRGDAAPRTPSHTVVLSCTAGGSADRPGTGAGVPRAGQPVRCAGGMAGCGF